MVFRRVFRMSPYYIPVELHEFSLKKYGNIFYKYCICLFLSNDQTLCSRLITPTIVGEKLKTLKSIKTCIRVRKSFNSLLTRNQTKCRPPGECYNLCCLIDHKSYNFEYIFQHVFHRSAYLFTPLINVFFFKYVINKLYINFIKIGRILKSTTS